jgi:8-oxo-dGTP diphosphatase
MGKINKFDVLQKIKCLDKNGKEYEFDESEYVYRKSVYGLVVFEGKVLMIVDSRVGRWEIPGGGVDEGESDRQALERELVEETGLKIDTSGIKLIDRVLGYYYSIGNKTPWKTDRIYYIVKLISSPDELRKEGNGDDVEKAAFIKISEMEFLQNVGEVDLEIIRKAVPHDSSKEN